MAYEPIGSEFLVNSATLDNQFEPTITGLAGGGFVVVWSDNSDDGGDGSSYDVKAQMFAADGSPVGGEFLVNSITSNFQALPTVTGLAGGGFVISWTDASLTNGYINSDDIRAQIFASDGSPVGGEFLVNSTISSHQEYSTITGLVGGGFVISWWDYSGTDGDSAGSGIRARIFSPDGSPIGSDFRVNTVTDNYQTFPTVTGLAGGGFVISWVDHSGIGGDSSGMGIKAQIFASDGSPVGGEFLVNSLTISDQDDPTITGLDGGGFVISWRTFIDNGTEIGIKAQIFASDGSPVGGEFLVNNVTLSASTAPAITGIDGGGFVISWVDSYGRTGSDSSEFGIHAQVFAADGSPVDGEFLVNSVPNTGQIQPTIARLNGGGFVISWSDTSGTGGDTSGYGVKAQIYAGGASPQAPVNSVPAAQSVDEDSTLTFTAANGNPVSISDADAGPSDVLNVTLSVLHGTLTVTTLTGLTFTSGDGAGDTTMTFHGTQSDINGALATLVYAPASDYNGPDALSITTNDVYGAPGGLQDADSVAITVNPVDDAAYQPVGGEFRVNTTTARPQLDPSITALADGGFVVTWMSYLSDGESYDIHAQRYAADGSASGPEFRVNTATEYQQYFPAVTALADGGFLVSWESLAQDAWGLYAQRYAADGSPTGAQFRINTTSPSEDSNLTITGLSDGGFVVSWQRGDDYYYFNAADVYAQRYAADGSPSGAEFRVNTTTDYAQKDPAITSLADGGFVVTWISSFQDGSGPDIYAQRYAADGSASGGEFRVNATTAASEYFPVITALTDGGFVVSWMSYPGGGGASGIYAQRYAADGSASGPEFPVSTAMANYQLYPSITALADGGFLISWMSSGEDGSGYGIYAQRYAADGSAAGTVFLVNTTTADNQEHPTIAGLANGGFVVSWVSDGQDGSEEGIYAQRYAGTGSNGGSDSDVTTTIDFDAETPVSSFEDWLNYYGQVSEDGFILDNVERSGIEFIGFTSAASDRGYYYNGPGVLALPSGETASFTHSSGQSFSVLSIDLDTRQAVSGQTVTFTGYTSSGDTVATTFELDSAHGMETFYFPETFTGLTSLQFVQSVFVDNVQFDNLVATTSINVIDGGPGDDTLIGTGDDDQINGFDGHDYLRGDGGNDELNGGNGDDYLAGSEGDDTLNGDAGYDRAAYYIGATAGVTVDLNLQGIAQDTGQGWDILNGIENLSGTAYADTLTGDAGDNWLWGSTSYDEGGVTTGANNDTLDGGDGNDLLVVGAGNHLLTGGSGTDTVRFTENGAPETGVTISLALQGGAQATGNGSWTLDGIENLSGGIADDSLTGDGNDNVLAGDAGNDTLSGGAGNDTLYGDGHINVDTHGVGTSGPIVITADGGAGGNDTLEGGLGDDTLDGGGGTDTASYANAGGGVNVNLGGGFAFGADGNDTLASIENVTGSEFNDSLTGNGDSNVLDGLGGNDFMSGGAGDDTLYGGDGDDFLQGDFNENNIGVTGNDAMYGGNGNDQMRGGLGDDQFYGGDGDDMMRGNAGVDYFDGGAEDGEGINGFGDRVSFFEQRATQGVVADLRTGEIFNDGFGNYELMVGIESLGADTAYVDTFYGNDGRNFLAGNQGDFLYGFGGDDMFQLISASAVVDGGDGIDHLRVFISTFGLLLPDTNGDGLAEIAPAATAGWSINLAAGTTLDGYGYVGTVSGIENVDGTNLADTIIGDANNNVLNGWDGDDTLEGGAGDDTLDGGNGVDTVSYANAAGPVDLNLGGGFADEYAADEVTYLSSDSLANFENAIGSEFADALVGDGGANLLEGLGGHDVMIGMAGDDTLHGGEGNDNLRGDQAGNGGLAGNDTLHGGNGNDFLNGGFGDDAIDGGAGYDRATYYTGATTGVTVDLNLQGISQNTVSQGMDTLTNIENVSGTAYADTLTGDGGDNWLWGSVSTLADGTPTGTNDDTIDGGDGNDLLTVGTGNHSLTGGAGTDTVSFTENGPAEPNLSISLELQGLAQATGAGNWILNGIENLSGGLAGDNLTGDSNDNVLAGDTGDDNLVGGAGNDTLYGDGRIAIDYAGGPGTSGPIATWADVATLNPALVNGNDTLEGGLGDDTLDGGGGIDTARYNNALGAVEAFLYNGGFGEAFGADGYDQLFNIESLTGSAFDDVLFGNNEANVLDGGDGHDFLQAQGGDDTVLGGNGDDYLGGGTGDDLLDGGAGFDRASFANGSTGGVTVDLRIQGVAQDTGLGMDTLIGIEAASGTAFSDTLIGNSDANWLWGGIGPDADTIDGQDGDDLIDAGEADHMLSGGTGTDTFRFVTTGVSGINVSLALQGAAQNTGVGMMTLSGFENLVGSQFGDNLTGDGNANVLAGAGGDDILSGGDGNDTLYGDGSINPDTHGGGGSGPITSYADIGANGNDTLDGGLGDDQLYGGGGMDTANYASATGIVEAFLYDDGFGEAFGAAGYDQLHDIENLTGSAFNDTLFGNAFGNVLDGGDGHDFLQAQAGDDIVLGGNGDDYLGGGSGNDLLDGGAGWDRVSFFNGATGGVTVDLNLQGIAQATGLGTDTLVGIEHLSGTAFSDSLTGDAGDNWLWGTSDGDGGNDTLDGGDGNDRLENGAGDHVLIGGAGIDTFSYTVLTGTSGINVSLALQGAAQDTGVGMMTLSGIENLDGSGYADTLTGDAGDNLLAGDGGDDTLRGGAGNDTLYGDGSVFIDGNGGSGPITIVADGGISSNDLLEGGAGNDTLDGGGGSDTASYADAEGPVEVNLQFGFADEYNADESAILSTDTLVNIENAIGSAFNDAVIGDDNTNVLQGLGGDDLIQGRGGDDTLYGGDGNDFLQGELNENNISVSGNDLLYGENGNDNLRGGLGDDQMYGGANNDLLRGNGGVDYFDGGEDDGEGFNGIGDRVSFYEQRATQGAVADLRTGVISNDGFGNYELMVGIESLGGGTAFADTFYGNDGRNYLFADLGDNAHGFGGDDIVQMGSAAALVDGGADTDRLILLTSGGWLMPDINADGVAEMAAEATSGWTVNLAAGTAVDGYGNAGMVAGFENVDGSVLGDSITGDGNANVLNGGDGDDTLEGGGGDDTLDGGNGIDTASYANASGGVEVNLGGGFAFGADGNDTLVNIENAIGSEFDDVLVGSNGDNVLEGRGGNDSIFGQQGNDTLDGGDGDDFITGGQGHDTIFGGAGADSLQGNQGDDTIHGGDGNDSIFAGPGNDTLYGGAGHDFLRGDNADGLTPGNDYIDAGDGFDRVTYYNTNNGVTVSLLLQGTAQDTGQGMDTLLNTEAISGSVFSDTFIGDDNDNWFFIGGAGIDHHTITSDTISANGGNDLIVLGLGNHIADGGSGTDTLGFAWVRTEIFGGVTVSLQLQGAAQDTGQGSMTLSGFENLSGSMFDDVFVGDDGDNLLAGNAGSDHLQGGAGNDVLLGDGEVNMSPINAGPPTVSDALDYAAVDFYDSVGNIVFLFEGQDLYDADGNLLPRADLVDEFGDPYSQFTLNSVTYDFYVGFETGSDGVAGNDTLEGGLGDDHLDGGGGIDTATYANASGGVTVNLGGGFAFGADGNDTLANIENAIGSESNDNLTGDGGNNVLDGLGGNDSMSGGAGDDTLYGGDGDDFLQGDFGENNISVTGNDVLYGENGNDNLRGGLGDDQMYGGANNDLLRGNGGVDYFDGGADDGEGLNGIGDRISFFEQRATQGAVADLRTGIISNDGFGNVELMVGIESLGADTAFADTFYGDDNRNYLAGNFGDNLYGFGGDDFLQLSSAAAIVDGGSGRDLLALYSSGTWLTPDTNADGLAEFAAAATAGWTVNLAAGTMTDGYGNIGAVTGIENVNGNLMDDNITGDANANLLNGLDGDDTLDGGAGDDIIDGGNGTDTASFASSSEWMFVSLDNSGNGLASNELGTENDSLISIENVTGSAFDDTILGNNADNVLDGGDGHDFMRGREGNDVMLGGSGDDYLDGGIGDDTLDGGAGWDRVSYAVGATGGVTVDLNIVGVAQATGAGNDSLAGIEHVSGTIFNDVLTGDGNDNWLWGGSDASGVTGNDVISAGGGNDLVEVGAGNHTLDGGTGNDTLSLWGNGTDISAGVTFSLASQGAAQATGQGSMNASGFENLSGSQFGDSLTGDNNGNILLGDLGNDTLRGNDGDDSLYGDGRMIADTHGGGSGPITLFGDIAAVADVAGGNDTLLGGRGNDSMYGGRGNDIMTGNQGDDRFVIEALSGTDRVTDFAPGIDTIVFGASSGVDSMSDLTLTKVGNNTVITWGTSDSLQLDGLKPNQLTAGDFDFLI